MGKFRFLETITTDNKLIVEKIPTIELMQHQMIDFKEPVTECVYNITNTIDSQINECIIQQKLLKEQFDELTVHDESYFREQLREIQTEFYQVNLKTKEDFSNKIDVLYKQIKRADESLVSMVSQFEEYKTSLNETKTVLPQVIIEKTVETRKEYVLDQRLMWGGVILFGINLAVTMLLLK